MNKLINSESTKITINIERKIDIATQTLERNIGFVSNCDNKASIVLTITGVLLTIMLTNDGLKEIFRIVAFCIKSNDIGSKIYLLCFTVSIVILLFGVSKLASVLVAKVSEKECNVEKRNSRIFFGDIHKHSNIEEYKNEFYSMKYEELLEDLVSQIYINADIANKKYLRFNKGFKLTITGFILFTIIIIMGICLY